MKINTYLEEYFVKIAGNNKILQSKDETFPFRLVLMGILLSIGAFLSLVTTIIIAIKHNAWIALMLMLLELLLFIYILRLRSEYDQYFRNRYKLDLILAILFGIVFSFGTNLHLFQSEIEETIKKTNLLQYKEIEHSYNQKIDDLNKKRIDLDLTSIKLKNITNNTYNAVNELNLSNSKINELDAIQAKNKKNIKTLYDLIEYQKKQVKELNGIQMANQTADELAIIASKKKKYLNQISILENEKNDILKLVEENEIKLSILNKEKANLINIIKKDTTGIINDKMSKINDSISKLNTQRDAEAFEISKHQLTYPVYVTYYFKRLFNDYWFLFLNILFILVFSIPWLLFVWNKLTFSKLTFDSYKKMQWEEWLENAYLYIRVIKKDKFKALLNKLAVNYNSEENTLDSFLKVVDKAYEKKILTKDEIFSCFENSKDDNLKLSIKRLLTSEENSSTIYGCTLSSIRISNHPFFRNIDWDLSENMNLLLGKNGYGKSFLLKIIYAVISNKEDTLSHFFEGATENTSIEITLVDREETYIYRKTMFEYKCVYITSDEEILIPNAKFVTLGIPTSRFINDVLNEPGIKYSVLAEKAFLSGDMKSVAPFFDRALADFCYQYSTMNRNSNESIERIINRFELGQIVLKTMKSISGDDFEFVRIENKNNEKYIVELKTEGSTGAVDIKEISHGTMSVITILIATYQFISHQYETEDRVLEKKGIVFIDEIDAHLHPSWQQMIINILRDSFPNIQFICTAHNPMIVGGLYEGEVSVLRRVGDDFNGRTETDKGFHIETINRNFIGSEAKEIFSLVSEVNDFDYNYSFYLTFSKEEVIYFINTLSKILDEETVYEDEIKRFYRILDRTGITRQQPTTDQIRNDDNLVEKLFLFKQRCLNANDEFYKKIMSEQDFSDYAQQKKVLNEI